MEKQAKCSQENVCSHARAMERLSSWAVQAGTSGPLSGLHDRVVLESFGRGAFCATSKSKSSFHQLPPPHPWCYYDAAQDETYPPQIYTIQIVSHCYRIVVGCQGGIDKALHPEPATHRCSVQAGLFLAPFSLSVLATDPFCLLF